MNKVFSAAQRKDKDAVTGRYTHSSQEQPYCSESAPKWITPAVCLVLVAIAVLIVILL